MRSTGLLFFSFFFLFGLLDTSLAQETWYTFQDGEWGDSNTWTLDGATAPAFVNPSSETPNAGDVVIIRNAHAITMLDGSATILNSVTITSITIRTGASLNLLTSTGHNFTDISGGGTLFMQGIRNENGDGVGANDVFEENLPEGDYVDFADPLLGGIIEINTGSNDIPFIFNDDLTGITTTASGAVSKALQINMTDNDDRAVIQRNITITGNLTVNQGNLQIHSDNSETYEGGTFAGGAITNTNLTITIDEDININTDGQITTGDANQRHQLNIDGNFTNDGSTTTSFTQRVTQNVGSEANDGIVDLNFLNTVENQTITCNGPTNFYRIEIDKGNQAIELTITASADGNFNLLGFANQGHGSTSQLGSNTNALGLIRGSVRLGTHANVEPLNNTGNYNISENAALIVDGAFVSKTGGAAIVPYGLVQVESGTLVSNPGSGITTRENGFLRVNGGQVYISQFRTSVAGASAVGGFEQNAGTVIVGDFSGITGPSGTSYSSNNPNGSFYTFSLTYEGNVFVMSGGTLSITEPSDDGQGSIFINSSPSNINVTGGTVNVTSTDDGEARISSKAPFYNLNIRNTTTSTAANRRVTVRGGSSGTGSGTRTIVDPDLRIINDLTIETGTIRGDGTGSILDMVDQTDGTEGDLYVGGNFIIQADADYISIEDGPDGGTGLSDADPHNVTYLQKSIVNASIVTFEWDNNPSLNVGDLVIDRDTGDEVRYVSQATTGQIQLQVRGNLEVRSGTFDQGASTIQAFSSVVNNDRLGTYYTSGNYPVAGGTPDNAQIRMLVDDITVDSDGAIFGNAQINASLDNPIEFTGDVTIERFDHQVGTIYIGANNLKIDEYVGIANNNYTGSSTPTLGDATETWIENAETSSLLRVVDQGRFDDGTATDGDQRAFIITDGNSSDGGLSLKVTANSLSGETGGGNGINNYDNLNQLTFPIGFTTDPGNPDVVGGGVNTYYRPAQVKVSGFSDDGYITIRPVKGELQTTNLSGGEILQHYWRVTHSDFTTLPSVSYRFYYRNREEAGVADLPTGSTDEANYVPGFVEDGGSYNRDYESASNAEQDLGGVFSLTADSDTRVIIFNGDNTGTTDDDLFGFSADAPGLTLQNANYTAGVSARFSGNPQIYYSYNASASRRDWNNSSSWSTVSHTSSTNTGTYPQAGDVAIIGYDGSNLRHQIQINNHNPVCASLDFEKSPSGSIPLLFIYQNVTNAELGVVSGFGNIYVDIDGVNDVDFNNTDFGQWSAENSNFWQYLLESGNHTLPSFPTTFPILRVAGQQYNGSGTPGSFPRSGTFTVDIECYQLIVDSRALLYLNDGANGDITCENEFRVGWNNPGKVVFPANNSRLITTSSLLIQPINGSSRESDSELVIDETSTVTHRIIVTGDFTIANNDVSDATVPTVDFTATSGGKVIVEFSGNGEHSFTNAFSSSMTPIFNEIIVNKGSNTTSTFTFNNNLSLPLPSDISAQPLEIVNGTLIINDPSIDITLTDAARGNFLLPNVNNSDASSGSGGLEIANGIVRILGAHTGIELDGPLILSGGDADFADGTNNNFIQYSVSGNASITINNAASELRVGTQIRRSTLSTAGILDLTISAGDLFIGEGNGGESSRGILEITNSGSSFSHTGGNITLLGDNNYGSTPTIASLFLEPASSTLTNSTIIVDLTNNDQDFSINSTIPLNNLTLRSTSGGGSETVELNTRALTVNGDLLVQNDIALQSNNLSLSLSGDFTLTETATYVAGTNKTTFSVANSQTNSVSGPATVAFHNFEKSGLGTLQLGSNISAAGATFDLLAGILDDDGNTITFTGQQFTNNATHSSPSSSNTNGLIFNGSSQQILQTSGTAIFGNLIIDNSAGVALPDVTQTYRINNTLVLDEGVIDIGPALFVLGPNSQIVGDASSEGVYASDFASFSETSQIQTNSSIIDFGVQKEFNASTTTDFVFPVGEATRYTPAEVSFSTAASGTSGSTFGSIRIRPRNGVAPIMLSESQAVQDAILQYYWLVNATTLTGFEADLIFSYDDEVIGTDPETSYQGAVAYFADVDNDVEDGVGTLNTVDNTITFPIDFPNTDPTIDLSDDNNFSGEYFAGDPTLIPDAFVAVLFDNDTGNGNVNDPANYCFDSNGDGDCTGEVRTGNFNSQIVGGNITLDESTTLNLNISNINFSRTTIPASATVTIGAGTSGHNLGQVSGSGTIQINSNSTNAALPVGDYANFFSSNCTLSGGALEYGGSGNYTVLNETNIVRNLLLNGNGNKTMVSSNVDICEDFRINDGSITFANGFTITINRDLILSSGTVNLAQNGILTVENDLTLTAGTLNGATNSSVRLRGDLSRGTTTVNLGSNTTLQIDGTSAQQITGDFTVANGLGSLTMNNDAGLTLNNDVEIDGTLTLTDGVITTSRPTLEDPILTTGTQLFMSVSSTSTAASDASYVNGMITKRNIGTSSNFTFPTGSNGFYAPVRVTNPSTVTNWTAYYVNSNPRNISNNINFGGERTISELEYWVVDGSGNATISITYGEQSGVSDATGLGIARLEDDTGEGDFNNSDEWVLVNVNNSSSDPLDGTLTTTNPQNFSTSIFTIGEQSSGALPIELTYFIFEEKENGLLLKWETATETENYGFSILRSPLLEEVEDDTTWTEVEFILGAGTTTQTQNYQVLDRGAEKAGKYAYYLKQLDFDGQSTLFGPIIATKTPPNSFALQNNYPNPFNPITTIPYQISKQTDVRIRVYDVIGRLVTTLVDKNHTPGTYQVRFDGARLASGIYFIRMTADGRSFTSKMLLVK